MFTMKKRSRNKPASLSTSSHQRPRSASAHSWGIHAPARTAAPFPPVSAASRQSEHLKQRFLQKNSFASNPRLSAVDSSAAPRTKKERQVLLSFISPPVADWLARQPGCKLCCHPSGV